MERARVGRSSSMRVNTPRPDQIRLGAYAPLAHIIWHPIDIDREHRLS
jgi:hypothetical protein